MILSSSASPVVDAFDTFGPVVEVLSLPLDSFLLSLDALLLPVRETSDLVRVDEPSEGEDCEVLLAFA